MFSSVKNRQFSVDEDFFCSLHFVSVCALTEGLHFASVLACLEKSIHLAFNMSLSMLAISCTSLCGMHVQGFPSMSSCLGHAVWELSIRVAEGDFPIVAEIVPRLSIVLTATKLHTKLQQVQAMKGQYTLDPRWISHPSQKIWTLTSIPEREEYNTQHSSVPMREKVLPLDLQCIKPFAKLCLLHRKLSCSKETYKQYAESEPLLRIYCYNDKYRRVQNHSSIASAVFIGWGWA